MKTGLWSAALVAGVVLGLGVRALWSIPVDLSMSPEDWYFFR
jgi:hypothetical protein